jgi:hypothetical protein
VKRSESSYRESSSDSSDAQGETYSSSTVSADESVESLVPESSKLRSPQAGRSNRRGLDKPSQKVILQDIENAGGLLEVVKDITGFCNTHVVRDTGSKILYGEQKSSERRRVENKIRVWNRLTAVEYLDILKDYQVPHHKHTGLSDSKASSRQDMPKKSSHKDSKSRKPAPASKSVSSKPTESASVSSKPSAPVFVPVNETPTSKMSSNRFFEMKGGVLHGTCLLCPCFLSMVGAHVPHNFLLIRACELRHSVS